MQQAMYTPETSHWYALINRAQVASDYYLQPDVENYLVYVLACMSSEFNFMPSRAVVGKDSLPATRKERRLEDIRLIGEQSLIVAGLFPDHAQRTGIPLLYLMDKGRTAYRELSGSCPGNYIYAYLSEYYFKVVDVLQKVSQICGDKHSIDLIQAVELWQETGSRHSWDVIQNNTSAFPITATSDLHH